MTKSSPYPTPLEFIRGLHFKREDLNPSGSVKDRALPFQLEKLQQSGCRQAVISSTGNAAISAAFFCRQKSIPLTVYVSPSANPQKIALLQQQGIEPRITPRPISSAFRLAKQPDIYFLRQSTDPAALQGYASLGREILGQLPSITSIFLPVGSGTTLLGISQALPTAIPIFAAQPSAWAPIARHYQPQFPKEKNNPTDALSVKLLPLKLTVIKAINRSGGQGIVVAAKDIQKQLIFLHRRKISTSAEGALALAAYYQALHIGLNPGNRPLILLTGTLR